MHSPPENNYLSFLLFCYNNYMIPTLLKSFISNAHNIAYCASAILIFLRHRSRLVKLHWLFSYLFTSILIFLPFKILSMDPMDWLLFIALSHFSHHTLTFRQNHFQTLKLLDLLHLPLLRLSYILFYFPILTVGHCKINYFSILSLQDLYFSFVNIHIELPSPVASTKLIHYFL